MSKKLHYIFLLIITAYFVLLIYNLAYLPIVWIDEIMDLDPAMRLIKGLGYNSFMWQYKGTEQFFLANLPLRNFPFIVFGYLFGADVFWIRIPHVLFFFGTCFFLWKLLKHFADERIAWIILLFFIFDKGIYESLRSVRCEIQQIFYLSAALYFTLIRRKSIIAIFFSGLLAMVHPASWILSILIAVKNIVNAKGLKIRVLGIIVYILPSLLWLWIINFDFNGIINQLISAGEDHTEKMSGFNVIINHFYNRFDLYIKVQPWVWLLVLFTHFIAIRNLIKNKDFISLLLLSHSLFWLLILAPNYRYNPSLLLLVYLVFARFFIQYLKEIKWQKVIVITLLIIQSVPFFSINSLGVIQRNERNPYKVQTWLSQNVELKNKTLICGESIGLYWTHNLSLNNIKVDFCAPNYPHKFDFSSYDNLILFSSEPLELNPFSEYKSNSSFPILENLKKRINSPTYNGMKLYKVSQSQLEEYCLKIRHGDEW